MEMCYLRAEEKEEFCTPGFTYWVEELKKDYPKVFEEISELPPHREEDHAICLELGTTLVNVRPY